MRCLFPVDRRYLALIDSPRKPAGTTHARRAVLAFRAGTLQAAIGIATLMMQVPSASAPPHQAVALAVLGFSVAHWRGIIGETPRETEIVVWPLISPTQWISRSRWIAAQAEACG